MNSFPSLLVEKQRVEAILKNKNRATYWEERMKAHEETKKNLKHYTSKLQEQIMVPIGKRGLMKGKLVNTNQVFVSIGDGWFVKVCSEDAQNVCTRRSTECKEMLDKLEKERKLLEGWTALAKEEQVFSNEDTKEIIEPYDEKEEESWRTKHAERLKEHRQKLAEVRQQVEDSREKPKTTEEELWRHLELLELQEEFEDELDRLSENSDSDDNTEESSSSSSSLDSDDDSDVEINSDETIENKILIQKSTQGNKPISSVNESSDIAKRPVKRVTFSDVSEHCSADIVHKETQKTIKETVEIGEIVERKVPFNNRSFDETRPISKFKSSKKKK